MSLPGPLLAFFPGVLGSAPPKHGPVCCQVSRSPPLLACQEACGTGPRFNFRPVYNLVSRALPLIA